MLGIVLLAAASVCAAHPAAIQSPGVRCATTDAHGTLHIIKAKSGRVLLCSIGSTLKINVGRHDLFVTGARLCTDRESPEATIDVETNDLSMGSNFGVVLMTSHDYP